MHHDLFAWGESLHFPAIVLCREPKDVLCAGRDAWSTLLDGKDAKRIARLQERRKYWQTKREEHNHA